MKLIYFDIKGLAEISRLLFAASGTSYEDFRYPFEVVDPVNHVYIKEQFDLDKSLGKFDCSMGKLPVLVLDDGTSICQSKAIERYLADSFGFFGSNSTETAKIDSLCECIRDLKDNYHKDQSPSKENYFNELPKKLLEFSKLIDNKGTKGFSVGSSLSLSDIVIYHFITHFHNDHEKAMKAALKSIKLSAIINKVHSHELIRKYIEERQVTPF